MEKDTLHNDAPFSEVGIWGKKTLEKIAHPNVTITAEMFAMFF